MSTDANQKSGKHGFGMVKNNKQLIPLFLIISFILSSYAYAQSNNSVDWDKIEYHLYKDLRAEHPDKSEAEIEQALGYSFFVSDNQWERAVFHFKKAVELDPKLYWSWYNLGLIYVDEEEGRDYFRKAIEANPDFSPAYYWLGYSLCRNRRDKEALPIFKKYLEVAKDDPQEKNRFEFANKLVKELLSGKEGENLSKIRE